MAAENRRVIDNEGGRRADLAAIHMAKAALGWDDDMYRDIMFTVCRVRSSAQMDFTGRKRFLEHLRKCQQQMGLAPRGDFKPAPWSPPLRALWSRWQQLADAGLVHERSRDALQAWVKRQCGVDRLEWLTTHQLDALLASAKLWLARAAKEGK
jgi:phage gp16-like protein